MTALSTLKRRCDKTRAYARRRVPRWRLGDLARDDADVLMVFRGTGWFPHPDDNECFTHRKISDGPRQ